MSRSPTIAFLVDYVFSSYQAGLLAAIEDATRERGFSLITVVGGALDAPLRSEATQNRVYELLDARTVDGVIIVAGCLSNNSGPVALAQYCLHHFKRLPMCSIGAALPGISSLVISNRQGTQACVEHLIVDHGARRIGFIGGPVESPEAAERYEGYLAALGKHEIRLDPRLVTRGAFTVHTGVAAARELFARAPELDAIVAANDYMAAAALDVAREHGRSVPRNLRIVGFDDAPFARYTAPPLTTVRQPLERLGRMAVDSIVKALDGEPLVDRLQVEVELVRRHSCGCGLSEPRRVASIPPASDRLDTAVALLRQRATLVDRLHAHLRIPPLAFDGWAERVLDGLSAELGGHRGRFAEELEALLALSGTHPEFIEEMAKLVPLLRAALYDLRPPTALALELEQLWHEAQIGIGNALSNAHGRTKVDLELMLSRLRIGFERISTALNLPALTRAVNDTLPSVNLRRAAVSLSTQAMEGASSSPPSPSGSLRSGSPRSNSLVPLLAVTPERALDVSREFPAQELAPPGFFPKSRHSHVVLPLTFEEDWLGVLVVEHTAHEAVYVLLRDQLSSALKAAQLHRTSLRELAARERADAALREQEHKLAAELLHDLVPLAAQVPGLTVAAHREPCDGAGADFYDVLPEPDGGWLVLGESQGVGLDAALAMLSLSALVTGAVRARPRAHPREIGAVVHAALIEQRERLGRLAMPSLSLVRYERTGQVQISFTREPPLIHRRQSGACEVVGAGESASGVFGDEARTDVDATLSDGDLLVLHTDGVIGATNEQGEPFGLERLQRTIRTHAGRSVEHISQAILDEVQAWQSARHDDLTVLVVRHAASDGAFDTASSSGNTRAP